jgi:hypothetical protein
VEGGQKTTATGTPVPTPLAAQTIETTKGDIGIPTHVRREIGRSGLHQVYPEALAGVPAGQAPVIGRTCWLG